MLPTREEILRSVTFKTSRSGGKGGQNSQINPSTLFAPQNKLTPPSAGRQKDLEKEAKKKHEEDLLRKKARRPGK